MANFVNHTPFPALKYSGRDQYKTDFYIITTRITYDLLFENEQAMLVQSSEHNPLNYVDEHYDDPLRTSVKFESDIAPYKPKTDIVIHATAFAPAGIAVPTFGVTIRIGEYRKTLKIHGPRFWETGLAGWELTSPEPIDKLDIRYEYASGGWYEAEDKTYASSANPTGVGWYPHQYLACCDEVKLPAPQIDSTLNPVKKISESIMPEGLGFFGRSWRNRIEYAGTFDDVWLKDRHPNLPDDFNFSYWNGAHPSLQIAHPPPLSALSVELTGLIPASELSSQHIKFSIPVEGLFVTALSGFELGMSKDMTLDTVVINMPERKVFCTYRTVFPVELKLTDIQLQFIAEHEQEHALATAKQVGTPISPALLKKGLQHG